jgi:glycosyltransferase involved in cell wall biosynthesis
MKSKMTFALTHRYVRSSINKALRTFKPDIVHVQCVNSSVLYALHFCRVSGVPLVITLQGELTMDAAGIFQRPGIGRRIMHRALTEADHVTACSQRALQDARDFLGRDIPVPDSVIFNGANIAEIQAASPRVRDRPYIFAMGRLVDQKGFDLLLEAVPTSLPENWDLVLAGDGPLSDQIQTKIAASPRRDSIDFIGRADRESVASLLRGCEFLVVPSRAAEGLPVVCAEAMAAGKPIVGTRIGGTPEAVVDGKTGLLVAPENIHALAQAIRELSSSSTILQQMGLAALERAQMFSWNSIAAKYEELYVSLTLRSSVRQGNRFNSPL